MIIYSPVITHRLGYMADFIGRELTGEPAVLTDRQEDFTRYHGPRINYSVSGITPDEIWIVPHGLLQQKGIKQQQTEFLEWNGQKAFFPTGGNIPFDILSASFYLLSRYEEYLPHKKDMYGRYAYENSLAYREGFLNIPLVNLWMKELKEQLKRQFPSFIASHQSFSFLPTYDIDEAWSFKHKTWWRSAGAGVKDLLKGNFNRFNQRRRVLNEREPDPFDSYSWINDLQRPYHLHPRYFFLVAEKNGRYDKNNLPSETAMQTLIQQHAVNYAVGVHPSWQSGDEADLIQKEKETIEKITKTKITASRQHFIRFELPLTYRKLIVAGIKEDFSMGYGSINGFRASVTTPFFWYDLESEQTTPLLLFPFCYMEANSFFEQKYSAPQALDEMYFYYNEVKKVNGTLVTIWHNTFLGTDNLFEGWRDIYAQFVKEIMT